MKNFVLLLCLSVVCCGKSVVSPTDGGPGVPVSSGGSTPLPSTISGDEYFLRDLGRQWVLINEDHPERVTTISMEIYGGAVSMVFRKNHPDTYHGAEGTNNNLVWYLDEDRGWIYPHNPTGGPDDIRISRATNAEVMRIWLSDKGESAPVCFLVPAGRFNVPSDHRGTFGYTAQVLGRVGSAYGVPSPHGQWWVRWSMAAPDILKIQFDESYSDNPAAIYEDWYLKRGVGLVAIRQYFDPNRTQWRRGVKAQGVDLPR